MNDPLVVEFIFRADGTFAVKRVNEKKEPETTEFPAVNVVADQPLLRVTANPGGNYSLIMPTGALFELEVRRLR